MRAPSSCLLEAVSAILRRTYRISAAVPSPSAFVIGDEGLRHFYGTDVPVRSVGASDGQGARTLVRETGDGVRAAIYYPDAMIRALEADPPQRAVHGRNVDAFATLVEEIDHFLFLADRATSGRDVSLFELELHANVSKRLVLARFLAGRARRLTDGRRVWLDWRLFHRGAWSDPDPRVRARYHDATRWALRFLARWERVRPGARLDVLRRFHAATANGKIRLIESLAD